MTFEKKSKRGIVIIGILMLVLFTGSKAYASPLYGGYNGESESWIEVFIINEVTIGFSLRVSLGIDSGLNASWVRVGISSFFTLPYVSKLEFSYETGDIASLSVTGLLPVKVGADTTGLRWAIVNLVVRVFGADTDGNWWWEEGLPGLSLGASGWDSKGNEWQWVKLFRVLIGWNTEESVSRQSISLSGKNSRRREKKLMSLRHQLTKAYGSRLRALLIEKFTDGAVMEGIINHLETLNARMALPIYENKGALLPMDPSSVMTSDLDSLLEYIEEEIFTDEIKDEINVFSDSFARDIKPQLEAVKK
jgi:hypothetical protein